MQFDAPSNYENRQHPAVAATTTNMTVKTEYSMYLPGMSRIAPTKPTVSRDTMKKIDDHNELKKRMSTVSIMKPVVVTTKKEPATTNDRDVNPAEESNNVISKIETNVDATKMIYYRAWPGGPVQSVPMPIQTTSTNTAAVMIQKLVRGRSARIHYYICQLERRLQATQAQALREVQAIRLEQEQQKVLVRRTVTQKQASFLKVQLDTKKNAAQGSELINYLRKENKKLREKNDKIAASIRALKVHNAQLENMTNETGENQNLLGTHFEKIQETNTLLLSVTPQYESKITELREALDVREQYCTAETKMKVSYMKLIGTITEMMEQDANDPTLLDEIRQFCADIPSEMIPSSSITPDGATSDLGNGENDIHERANQMPDYDGNDDASEYEEVSVRDEQAEALDQQDDDDTDSNNYDDYTIAGMES